MQELGVAVSKYISDAKNIEKTSKNLHKKLDTLHNTCYNRGRKKRKGGNKMYYNQGFLDKLHRHINPNLIEDWDEPNPNHFSFTIDKSTIYKTIIHSVTIVYTTKGCHIHISLNGWTHAHTTMPLSNSCEDTLIKYLLSCV